MLPLVGAVAAGFVSGWIDFRPAPTRAAPLVTFAFAILAAYAMSAGAAAGVVVAAFVGAGVRTAVMRELRRAAP